MQSSSITALVLGGGNALGAYHGGAVTALAAENVRIDWIAGSSIGAITAALIAGTPPDRREAALREFWRRARFPLPDASWVPTDMRRSLRTLNALGARLIGRPALFHIRSPFDALTNSKPGLYDADPLRRTLSEMVDFDRLNNGEIRVSAVAIDVETGEEVVFDTQRERVGIDHLLASSALIPDFQPVDIGGRALVDGGLGNNVPVDVILSDPSDEPLTCFVLDLFPTRAARPSRYMEASQRQNDLMFANQTRRNLGYEQESWRLRQPERPGAVYWIEYRGTPEEVALKSYDFSDSILRRRWEAGEHDMRSALREWKALPALQPGLAIHRLPPADEASSQAAN